MKRLSALLFLLCFAAFVKAQNHPLFVSTGAKSLGLANTYVNQGDLWSNFNNQSGLSEIEDLSFGIFGESRFMGSNLATMGFAAALPTQSGTFGVGFKRFGYKDLFNQSNISINYGRILTDKINTGIGLSYLNTFIGNNYGSSGALSANIGLNTQLKENLKLGAHISNINRAKLDDFNNERYPTIFTLGLQYDISEKVQTFLEVDKDISHKQSIRGAMNYDLDDTFSLRVGVATNPTLFSFGFGYGKNAFRLDIGSSYHQILGLSSNITLLYSIQR